MSYTTPKDFIAYLANTYQNDMNQPIMVLQDSRDSLKEFILNSYDDVFANESQIPNELLDKCLSNLSDDDRVHEAINDSYKYDIQKYIDEYMQEHDDKELWNN